jgi:hypothetical protein
MGHSNVDCPNRLPKVTANNCEIAAIGWRGCCFRYLRTSTKEGAMLIRPILVLIAILAAIATYFAGLLQGIDERWPALAASIAVGTMLVLFLHLFVGDWKVRPR